MVVVTCRLHWISWECVSKETLPQKSTMVAVSWQFIGVDATGGVKYTVGGVPSFEIIVSGGLNVPPQEEDHFTLIGKLVGIWLPYHVKVHVYWVPEYKGSGMGVISGIATLIKDEMKEKLKKARIAATFAVPVPDMLWEASSITLARFGSPNPGPYARMAPLCVIGVFGYRYACG